jgi:hypothetical protein
MEWRSEVADIQAFAKGLKAGGNRAGFLKVSQAGKYTLRLFRYAEGKSKEYGFTFQSHRLGQKESQVCPKTFDPGAECTICDDVAVLYDEGNKKEATARRAKSRVFVCAVDVTGDAGGSPDKFGCVEVSGGGMATILACVARVAGWTGSSPNWDDSEFIEYVEKGSELCFGPRGRDLKVTTNPQALPKDFYVYDFSKGPGKTLGLTEEQAPNMREKFMAVKAGEDGEEQTPGKTEPKVAKKPVAKAKAKAKSKKQKV